MTILDDREHAFENMFAHDAEMKFKAVVRRNKLLGLWAADLLGKDGEEATAYASEVVAVDFQRTGREAVLQKIRADFEAHGVAQSDEQIREKMLALLPIAAAQIQTT